MMGLLKKASLLTSTEVMPDFFSYCKNNSISHFCILEKNGNNYFISNSYGFDYESIAKSYSTEDFWNGTITEKNQNIKFDNSLYTTNPLLQFFSNSIQNKLKEINVLYKDDNKIYINCNSDIKHTEFSKKNNYIFNLSESDNLPLNKYQVDFSSYIEQFIIKNINISEENQKTTIFNEISNRLLTAVSELKIAVKIELNSIYLYIPDTSIKIDIIISQFETVLKEFSPIKASLNVKSEGKILFLQEFDIA